MTEQELTRDEKIDRIISLFEEIEAALKLFVRCGNALKFLLGLGTAIGGAWMIFKGLSK